MRRDYLTPRSRRMRARPLQRCREHTRFPAAIPEPHVVGGWLTQQPVYLLDGVFWVEPFRNSEAFADEMHAKRCSVQHADHAIGQREHTLGVKVLADELLNELMHVSRRELRLSHSAPQGLRFFKLNGLDRFFHGSVWTNLRSANSRNLKIRLTNEGIPQGSEGSVDPSDSVELIHADELAVRVLIASPRLPLATQWSASFTTRNFSAALKCRRGRFATVSRAAPLKPGEAALSLSSEPSGPDFRNGLGTI